MKFKGIRMIFDEKLIYDKLKHHRNVINHEIIWNRKHFFLHAIFYSNRQTEKVIEDGSLQSYEFVFENSHP